MNNKEHIHRLVQNKQSESHSVMEETFIQDDPVIRAAIDKFNHETAVKESDEC